MLFLPCQAIKIKCLDEILFIISFTSLLILNKFELLNKWLSSPTSYQGWQVFFTVIVFFSLLICQRIRNEVKILNISSLCLILPVSVSYAIALAAASAALSKLSVPVFIACTNLTTAILTIMIKKKNKNVGRSGFLACFILCLSVVIIFLNSNETDRQFYLYLLIHVVINIVQSLYMKRINLQTTDFTQIFYNNLVSLIFLFPVSIYNATEANINFDHIFPCFITGFLSLALQIFSFRVKLKNNRHLTIQGIAQLICILTGLFLFQDVLDFWIWCLVGINWFMTGFILCFFDEDLNKNSQLILIVPQLTRNIYVEKYVNYNDMA